MGVVEVPSRQGLLRLDPTLTARAHEVDLTVVPCTFQAAGVPRGQTVRDEMASLLYDLGVDAIFADNPDQFPRR